MTSWRGNTTPASDMRRGMQPFKRMSTKEEEEARPTVLVILVGRNEGWGGVGEVVVCLFVELDERKLVGWCWLVGFKMAEGANKPG